MRAVSHILEKLRGLTKCFSKFRSINVLRWFFVATFVVVGTLFLLYVLPTVAFFTGNIFFGDFRPLYNVRFAQVLFRVAAHPVLPVSPPRYVHYQLSRTYFVQGKLYDALDEARKELSIYPDNVYTYYILGLTYGYLGRTHEGIDAFSEFVNARPHSWAGRNDKAWLQFRIGDYEGALATIEPIIDEFPLTPWVQNTHCILLIKTERYEDASRVCANAKALIFAMTSEDWGRAYPGNDPRIYHEGILAMRRSIEENVALLENILMDKHGKAPVNN